MKGLIKLTAGMMERDLVHTLILTVMLALLAPSAYATYSPHESKVKTELDKHDHMMAGKKTKPGTSRRPIRFWGSYKETHKMLLAGPKPKGGRTRIALPPRA